jgi:hypothetical protein
MYLNSGIYTMIRNIKNIMNIGGKVLNKTKAQQIFFPKGNKILILTLVYTQLYVMIRTYVSLAGKV